MDWKVGDAAGVEAAFAPRRPHRHGSTSTTTGSPPIPIEPRGSVGLFDPASGRYTLHISSQSIHANRNHAARCLGVEPKDVRFIAPDVAAASAPRTSFMPNTCWSPGRRAKQAGR